MDSLRIRALVFALKVDTEARADAMGPQRGMSVPYFGNFSSAPPSVIRELRWYVRQLVDALDAEPEDPRPHPVCACGCGASLDGKHRHAKYLNDAHAKRVYRREGRR